MSKRSGLACAVLFLMFPVALFAQFGDANLVVTFEGATIPTAPSTFTPVAGGVTLTGNFVQIGITDAAHLGYFDAALGRTVGLRFDPAGTSNFPGPTQTANYDVITPGCLCEGWGIRADTAGGPIYGIGDGSAGVTATLVSFGTATVGTTKFAKSVAMVGPLEITHVYSVGQNDRFAAVTTTIRNTGATAVTNIRYVRSVDFDIDASNGGAFTTDKHNTLNELAHPDILRAVGTVQYLVAHGLGSKSPFAISDSITFADPDPDVFVTNRDANDALGDNSESFRYNIASLAAGATSAPIQYLYMVGSEAVALPAVTITASDPNAAEPSDTGTFTITRTGATTAALTVNYTVTGTATSGVDYTALSGTATIPAGSASTTVTVTPIDDLLVEGPETVIATLTTAAGYNVGAPSSATVTIADNDSAAPATVTVTPSANAAEPSTAGTFTFTRTGATTAPLTINYTIGGTATAGADYTALTGSVTIPAGAASATVNVTPIDDTIVEPTETVVVTLAAGTGYTAGSPATATVNIADDDSPVVPVPAASDWALLLLAGMLAGVALLTLRTR